MTKIAQLSSLINELREEGMINLSIGDGYIRAQFSTAKHPDLPYARRYHSEGYDQYIAKYAGVEVLYLVDGNE